MSDTPPDTCPHCGELLEPHATFCRACGASDGLGWGPSEAEFAGETWIEEEFDYDEFVRREFPDAGPPAQPNLRKALFALVAVLLIIALIRMTIGL